MVRSRACPFVIQFRSAYSFNQPVHGWQVGAVTNMQSMVSALWLFGWYADGTCLFVIQFLGATDFNQPIGDWDAGMVTNMKYMVSAL
jgi:Mycoplasma protein of unknown function, DUF285